MAVPAAPDAQTGVEACFEEVGRWGVGFFCVAFLLIFEHLTKRSWLRRKYMLELVVKVGGALLITHMCRKDEDPNSHLHPCLPPSINELDDVSTLIQIVIALGAIWTLFTKSFGLLFADSWRSEGFSGRVSFSLNILPLPRSATKDLKATRRPSMSTTRSRARRSGNGDDDGDEQPHGHTFIRPFKMRTLHDLPIQHVYPHETVVETVLEWAKEKCDVEPVNHPFLCLQKEDKSLLSWIAHRLCTFRKTQEEFEEEEEATLRRMRDQLKNAISSFFGRGFIFEAMHDASQDHSVKTAKFVYGLTFEKRLRDKSAEYLKLNRKYRCLIIREDHLEQINDLRMQHGDEEWVNHVQLEDYHDALAVGYAKERLYHLAHLHYLYKKMTQGRDDDKALIGDVFLGMPPTGGGTGDAGLRESSQNWTQSRQ
jgi:hypothetical protein